MARSMERILASAGMLHRKSDNLTDSHIGIFSGGKMDWRWETPFRVKEQGNGGGCDIIDRDDIEQNICLDSPAVQIAVQYPFQRGIKDIASQDFSGFRVSGDDGRSGDGTGEGRDIFYAEPARLRIWIVRMNWKSWSYCGTVL